MRSSLPLFFYLVVTVFTASSEDLARIIATEGSTFTLVRKSESHIYDLNRTQVKGMTIYSGDMILTESDTFVEVQLLSGQSFIKIAGDTTFIFENIGRDGSGVFKLIYGRVRARVDSLPPKTDFYITGYDTVAGVRGTDFGYDLLYNRTEENPEIISKVYCFEGSVDVAWVSLAAEKFSEIDKMGYNQEIRSIYGNEMITLSSSRNKIIGITKVEQEIIDFWNAHPFDYDKVLEEDEFPEYPEEFDSSLNDMKLSGKRKNFQTAGLYTMGIGCGIMFTSLFFYTFMPVDDSLPLALTYFGGGISALGLGYIGLSYIYPEEEISP